MAKIILTESQFKKIVSVIKEQEESVFKLTDVDGEVDEVGNGSLDFLLYLMGEDNEGNEVNKTLELVIDFTVEESEPSTYDYPGYGGGYDWDIVSARQVDPEQKQLNLEDIKSLYKNSMIVKLIEEKIENVIDNYEPEYDPYDD
jgi:hypothetical protein